MALPDAIFHSDGALCPKKETVGWRNIPNAKRGALLQQPQFHDINGESKLRVKKPLTDGTRRIITNTTIKLIQKREQVDQALLRESERELDELAGPDWLPREQILRQNDALARRESRHLRVQKEALEERKRLYDCDPSTERALDIDLFRSLLSLFKRHLGPYLKDRERPVQPGEDDDASPSSGRGSDGEDDNDSEDGIAEVHSGFGEAAAPDDKAIPADSSSSDHIKPTIPSASSPDEASSDPADLFNSSSSEDEMRTTIPGLDGSFDDQTMAQPIQSKKRKVTDGPADLSGEKEQRKRVQKEAKGAAQEAKKEHSAKTKHITGASASPAETRSAQPSTSTPNKNADLTGETSAFDSMSQSKKISAISVKPVEIAAQDNGRIANCDEVHGNMANGNTTNGATTGSSKTSDKANIVEPWYKRYARDMMMPDFNDHVHDERRPKRLKRPNPEKEKRRFMRGAILPLDHDYLLPDSDSDGVKKDVNSDKSDKSSDESVRGALPSPPASSTTSSSDMGKRVDKRWKDPSRIAFKHKKQTGRFNHGKSKSQAKAFNFANSKREVGKARSMPQSPVSDP